VRILTSQIEHLGRRSVREYTERIAGYLRDEYPKETAPMDDADLAEWVDRNMRRAMSFGVDTEPEVAQYLMLCLRLGEEAPDRLPWFRAPLESRKLVGEGKMRAIVRAAWDEAVPDLARFVMKSFATWT
jgi:hypothetical protein